ncbi:putative membrane protein [Georgenia soli]|uniref:Putative membrane protein n=1 Tax=Georgenia soli TaxID=638953 RepID=A0A2A9ES44_9MICO|nr:SHOCT domain-containing protein [Georgenia soli]PFG41065.1 putative membrane protein [Georgenia soli]
MMYDWHGMGWWMGLGWVWIILLLLLVGVVVLVVLLVRGQPGGGGPHGQDMRGQDVGRSRARAILDERYARGEIDTTEYQERLRVLGER